MSWQKSIQTAVRSLKREEKALEKKLSVVQAKIQELETIGKGRAPSARPKASRRLSPQGRAAISRAAKKRWAEYRKQKKKGGRRG